jgi:hypothetical protein
MEKFREAISFRIANGLMELASHGVFQDHEAAEVGALGLSTFLCEAPTCVRQVLVSILLDLGGVVVRAGRGPLFAVDDGRSFPDPAHPPYRLEARAACNNKDGESIYRLVSTA